MAATVVAVVVFLCGVLVGRGVPLKQAMTGRGLVRSVGDGRFVPDEAGRPAAIRTPSGEPSAAALAGDDLTYNRRLDGPQPVDAFDPLDVRDLDARLGDAAPTLVPDDDDADVVSDAPATEPSSPPPPRRPLRPDAASTRADAAPATPVESSVAATARRSAMQRDGFTVQVTALRERDAAERVAEGLMEKGYPAFVADPLDDAPVLVFRVRVGRYDDRAEAERILQRLEQEEQLKPWITH